MAHCYTKEEGGTAETEEEAKANQKKEKEAKAKANQAKKQQREEGAKLPAEKQEAKKEPTDQENETFVEATRAGIENVHLN